MTILQLRLALAINAKALAEAYRKGSLSRMIELSAQKNNLQAMLIELLLKDRAA